MIHFETYHVHLLKPAARAWTDEQESRSGDLIDDEEFCGLLEIVTDLYLRQRAKRNPLAADLVAGARNHYDHELVGYDRPFKTETLYGLRPLLRAMLADLDSMPGTRQVDADYARQRRRERRELAPVEDGGDAS